MMGGGAGRGRSKARATVAAAAVVRRGGARIAYVCFWFFLFEREARYALVSILFDCSCL